MSTSLMINLMLPTMLTRGSAKRLVTIGGTVYIVPTKQREIGVEVPGLDVIVRLEDIDANGFSTLVQEGLLASFHYTLQNPEPSNPDPVESNTPLIEESNTPLIEEPVVLDAPVPESSVPESLIVEDSVPESSVPESSVPESLIVEDSVPESSVPESLIVEETKVIEPKKLDYPTIKRVIS